MKFKIILSLGFLFSILSFSQDSTCTVGAVIGNNEYSNRPMTIVYTNTVKAKCKKGNSLYLDQGVKNNILLQFFTDINKNHPQAFLPFKNNTLVSAISVWVVKNDAEFKARIDNHYGTSFKDYNIIKINDFNYDQNKYKDYTSALRKKDDKAMRTYLNKN